MQKRTWQTCLPAGRRWVDVFIIQFLVPITLILININYRNRNSLRVLQLWAPPVLCIVNIIAMHPDLLGADR